MLIARLKPITYREQIIEYLESLFDGKSHDFESRLAYKKDAIKFCGLSNYPLSSRERKMFDSDWRFFTTVRNGAWLIKNPDIRNAWFYMT